MTVFFLGTEYQCVKAVKNDTSAVLYLEDENTINFNGVNDWSAFALEGGGWSAPELTPEEQLQADVSELKEALGLLLSGVTE